LGDSFHTTIFSLKEGMKNRKTTGDFNACGFLCVGKSTFLPD